MGAVIAILLIVLAVAIVVVYAVIAIQQVREGYVRVIERFGQFERVLKPGLHMIAPFIERVHTFEGKDTPGKKGKRRKDLDMRTQSIVIPKQRVITRDDLIVDIDSIVFLTILNPVDAVYRVKDYEKAVERLVVTNLRNFVGEKEFDDVLNSRDEINRHLRGVLDEATGGWGLRVSRVEVRDVLPSEELQEMLQTQARAERDRRAKILEAEGHSDSDAIRAEGRATALKRIAEAQAQAKMTMADGDAEAQRKVAKGQADAIATVFEAIHKGNPDQQLLAYEYLRTLPELAHGDANKLWIVPSELGHALEGIGSYFGSHEAVSGQHGAAGADDSGGQGGSPQPVPGGAPPSQDPGEAARLRLAHPDGAAVPEQRQSR